MVVRFFPVIEILRKRSAHDTAGMLSWRVGRFHAIDTQAWYYGKVNIPSNLNYDETDVSEMSFWTQMSQIIHECKMLVKACKQAGPDNNITNDSCLMLSFAVLFPTLGVTMRG